MVSRPAIINFPAPDRSSQIEDAAGLRAEIERLQGELVQVREQLTRAQRLESIGALAGGIAHDLNNVLTPILMSIALLEEQLTDGESRRLLGVLHQSAQRGATMVQQVLTLTRDIKHTPVSAHPRHLLEDLRKLIAESFPHSIELVIEVAADVADVNANPTQLRQLLVNLCVDARDSMPGGGLLTLRAENATVDAAQAARFDNVLPGAYVVISVADSRTLGAAENRSAQLERHDGFVTRDYEIGRGNIARVFVRAGASTDAGIDIEVDAEWPRGQDELVLVVDDESSVRSITSQLLSAYGYRVRTAATGAEAVAEFAKNAGDIGVVLTDLMMPVMDGANTIRALRTIEPGVKVIAATGIDGPSAAGEGAPRIDAFITKPFRAETLLRVVRQVLDRQDAL